MSGSERSDAPTALVDDEARTRISATGLHELLFVEAGAGTGKTKQLVDRVVALVLDAGVPMRAIAAITFTEAAASELRARVREAFERLIEDVTTSAPRRLGAEQALADLDGAAIGTVHAFAQRILSEHPVEAGLPPHVEVLDEVETLLAFGRRWEEQVDRMFADPALDDVIICARLLGVRVDHARMPSLRDIATVFADNWDRIEAIAATPVALPAVDRGPALAAMAALDPVLDRCRAVADDKLAERLLGFETEMASVRRTLESGSDRAVWRAIAGCEKWSHKNLGKADAYGGKDGKQAVVDTVIAAETALEELRLQAADAVLTVFAGEVARFTLASARERRREGRLEFHDLLVLARELLRTDAEARRSLHDRYERLLVDEFQDTDPIQIEVATLIAASVTGPDPVPGRWEDVAVEPARLFFVGDPKQSIYRFRRADIGLFLQARDRFAGEAVRLTTNFRTVAPILAWVNDVFGGLMAEEIPGRRPQYEPLAARREPSAADHRVTLLGVPHEKAEKLKAGPLRELEAATVADAIAGILADPDAWPVEEKGTPGSWRPARPEDIAILIPTRTSLGVLTDALRERGVEFRAETGTLVYETQEVRDLVAVLRAIAFGSDAIALVAALRSAIFACADDDLVTYVAAGGRWEIGRTPPVDLSPDHPVVAALDYLDGLRSTRWWTGPSDLLERLVEDRQVMALGFGAPRARDVWRRVRFLIDQARLFESSQSADLVEFVAWCELQRSDMARVHEPLLPESDDHAVRIMTMHGAKGLEFPITVLSGLTTKISGRRAGVRVLFDGDRVEVSARKGVGTVGFDRRADLEVEMDEEEKLRLLYVACTRARDHLLIGAHHIEGSQSFAQMVWEAASGRPQDHWRHVPGPAPATLVVHDAPESVAPVDAAAVVAAHREWCESRERLLTRGRVARTISATELRQAAAGGVALDAEADDGEAGTVAALVVATGDEHAPAWRRGRAATAFGRAVHAVLEAGPGSAAELAARARQAAAVEGLATRAEEVAAAAGSALRAAVVAAAGSDARRELYVAAPVGGRTIEGFVDLLVPTPDGYLVVDYKTDAITDPAARDRKTRDYAVQLAAYALVIEAVTGTAVAGGVLVFADAAGGAPVERRIERADLPTDRVRELLSAG